MRPFPPELYNDPSFRALLEKAQEAAPAFYQQSAASLRENVKAGHTAAFWLDDGLTLLERHTANGQHRLLIVGFYAPATGFRIRHFAKELQRIAAEWLCDTIETTCYSKRLVKAITLVGGQVESIQVTLKVE